MLKASWSVQQTRLEQPQTARAPEGWHELLTLRALSPQEAQCTLAHRQRRTWSFPRTMVEESNSYFEPCEHITDEELQQAGKHSEKSKHREKGTIRSCRAHTVDCSSTARSARPARLAHPSTSARAAAAPEREETRTSTPCLLEAPTLGGGHIPSRTFCSAPGHFLFHRSRSGPV